FVGVGIHSYRHRFGDPPPATDVDAPHCTGRYERRTIPNVGHNFPQEAPEQFARAVLAPAGSENRVENL
ncbi:MAG: alpha/beta fold hydrolase, partial [Steroidobacteraceae bacterium]